MIPEQEMDGVYISLDAMGAVEAVYMKDDHVDQIVVKVSWEALGVLQDFMIITFYDQQKLMKEDTIFLQKEIP